MVSMVLIPYGVNPNFDIVTRVMVTSLRVRQNRLLCFCYFTSFLFRFNSYFYKTSWNCKFEDLRMIELYIMTIKNHKLTWTIDQLSIELNEIIKILNGTIGAANIIRTHFCNFFAGKNNIFQDPNQIKKKVLGKYYHDPIPIAEVAISNLKREAHLKKI
ncbi:hypothetical protein BpHYR1_053166 [Brachionus plicatilis]|uniref:Uncharacterized protein n=1 Tax=Brachionus plicatilis TaxID=10195 RepID=A0A3M7QNU0_BRAPC|nr:hypothetical protein BpHYR1_053166 [Brachionus plicatilis]